MGEGLMPTRDWVEGISAGATLVLISLGALFVVLRRFLKSWREFRAEMRAGVDAAKAQATTAATQSTTAANVAAKVDSSLHTNNGGTHVKDFQDEVRASLTHLRRDIGGIRHDVRTLAEADIQLHQRIADLERKGAADRS